LEGAESGVTAVVYTAISGDYDSLKQPAAQNADCEFVCFTDSDWPARIGAWRVQRFAPDPALHPRMRAKRPKILSHEYFPGGRWRPASFWSRARSYDLSIWVDGSIEIGSSRFVGDMRALLGAGDWAMFRHPDRDCIYEEAELSLTLPKYQGLPIHEQVETYRGLVPPHAGLYACGVIVRREPVSELLQAAALSWWSENVRWTYQDQLSLPYVIAKHPGSAPVAIDAPLRSNAWFRIRKHAHVL
jgi:O-antigen biosynthesis protein